jgi:hypothetical protein
VDNYQDAFVDLMDWMCGQPLEVREKLSKVGSGKIKVAFDQLKNEGMKELSNTIPIFKAFGILGNTVVGTWIAYIGSAIWSMNDSSASIPSALINRTLKLTFDELGIKYTGAQLSRASKAIGKLAYGFYDKEQGIAKFCFFHALTMYKAGGSIPQSHWPEQSLAWFAQCKPSESTTRQANTVSNAAKKGLSVQTDSESTALHTEAVNPLHEVYASFTDDPDNLYEQGTRSNGEILGIVNTPDAYYEENVVITSWNLYNSDDFFDGKAPLKTVAEDYELSDSDPEYIVITPNVEEVSSKHVKLWLNKAMTGFDKDILIGEFDVYDGGYYYIAQTPLPEGISDEGFDVLY